MWFPSLKQVGYYVRNSLVCFWIFLWYKSTAILNFNWLDFFTKQSVESVMVNLIIPLPEENSIAKNLVNPRSACIQSPASNCLYARIFCCGTYQCSLEGTTCISLHYCRGQGFYLVFLGAPFKIVPNYQFTLGAQF